MTIVAILESVIKRFSENLQLSLSVTLIPLLKYYNWFWTCKIDL